MTKIIVFAGSARKESTNKKLAKYGANKLKEAGVEATFIDLADYTMPIYDGDLEDAEGLPENAQKLKKLFMEHDGFLIASPEYNGSFSPLLKNVIDWASRAPQNDSPPLSAYKGKTAGIFSTSPGGLGGLRGLVHLRSLLGNIGVHVIPNQAAIGGGFEAFDDNGNLVNENHINMVNAVVEQLAETTKKLKG